MGKSKKLCKKKCCKVCENGVVIDGKIYCINEILSACKNFYPKEKK